MKYTHIVFDIDGTLLDTEKAVLLSLKDIVQEYQNRTMDINELRFALGIPGQDVLVKLGFDNLEHYNALWMQNFENYFDTIQIFDGINYVLNQLKKQNYSLGIITSKTTKEYETDFIPFGLADYFDTVICAEDSIKHKPFSEPMEKYLECSGARQGEVLYIGDTIYDLQCAKGANVDFALALWGCKTPDDICADYVLEKPEDIIDKCILDK